MIVTYKNNRFLPAIIISGCIWLLYLLMDPTVDNWRGADVQDQGAAGPQDGTRRTESPTASTHAGLSTDRAFTTTAPPTANVKSGHSDTTGRLSVDDVLLIMKTGSTIMWKRLLVHLATTFDPGRIPLKNTVVYSDYSETIGSFQLIDALANVTKTTKALSDFDVYRQHPQYAENNVYAEAAGIDGDNYGPPGGWIIDKYKFVPLMAHAGANWPKAKWYIYMEDDAYLFLPSILDYLSGFDWRQPHYLGSYAAKSDVVFAHGGAGFALSRAAWKKSFGRDPTIVADYEAYTSEHCCGDQVLGHALNKHGVRFGENGGDEKFTWGFNPIVHWRFGFSRWNWCSRLLSWHKVHNRDVARYYAFEKAWDFTKPLLHRDFFLAMIAPGLAKRAEWWDNFSGVYKVT